MNQPSIAEAHFSPGEACRERISELIGEARQSIDVCVFTITDNRLAEPLMSAHARGTKVRIITDNYKADDRGSDVDRFVRAGLSVREDRSENHMHHKYALFDGELLLTGSYNWTRSAADRNRENIVIVNDARLVRAFGEDFDQLWGKLGD